MKAVLRNSRLIATLSFVLAIMMVFTLLPHELIATEITKNPGNPPITQQEEGVFEETSPLEESSPDEPAEEPESETPPQDGPDPQVNEPLSIITGVVTDISSISAMLQGSLAGSNEQKTTPVWFEYGPNIDFESATEQIEMQADGEFTVVIENLAPDTVYYYRAMAMDNETECKGEIIAFCTLPVKSSQKPETGSDTEPLVTEPAETEPVEPTRPDIAIKELAVKTGQVYNITANRAEISGFLDGMGVSDNVQVRIEFGPDKELENSSKPLKMNASGEFRISINGLQPGIPCFYRVAASDDETEVYGDVKQFTTLEEEENKEEPENESEKKNPERSSISIKSSANSELKSASEKIKLEIPKGAIDSTADVELLEYSDLQPGFVSLFELNAEETESKKEIKEFNKELKIEIQHGENDLKGLDPDTLRLYYLDEAEMQWIPVEGSNYDKESGVLTANLSHFTYFGEQANPLQNGPGRVLASQVDLHSGSAVFSYPFELPPGPGGFQPVLSLSYNSGSVNEMKNKRDVGSWVGIGWSLNPGRISYDSTGSKYYLELSGVS